MRIATVILTAGTAGLLAATPALAQFGNGSDVSGPPTTGSSIAGGSFAPASGNGGGAGVGATATASPAVNAAIGAAGASVSTQLASGSMPAVNGVAIPAQVQASVGAVLSGSASPAQVQQISTALGASGNTQAAAALVDAMSGLAAGGSPAQLTAAIVQFNILVSTASVTFLANPPAAFLAIAATLNTLSASVSVSQATASS